MPFIGRFQFTVVNVPLVLLFSDYLNLTVTLNEALSQVNGETCATVPQNVTFVTPVMKLTLLEECSSKIQNESVIDHISLNVRPDHQNKLRTIFAGLVYQES